MVIEIMYTQSFINYQTFDCLVFSYFDMVICIWLICSVFDCFVSDYFMIQNWKQACSNQFVDFSVFTRFELSLNFLCIFPFLHLIFHWYCKVIIRKAKNMHAILANHITASYLYWACYFIISWCYISTVTTYPISSWHFVIWRIWRS